MDHGMHKMQKKPLISVIVPHQNQPRDLDACLGSLYAQSLEPGAFEVIVVDNGSTSPPLGVVERYPGTVLLQELRPGPGPARNRGVEVADGEILAFTDADCRVHPDWLGSALAAFEHAPRRTILGGDVRIWREPNTKLTAIEAYESVFAYRFKLYIEQHGFCGTGNLIMRRSDFDDIGPFRGIDVAEDMEWGRRARAAGYVFRYIPGMIVFHPPRRSIRELFVKWDRHIQHAVNAGRRSRSWRAKWMVRALAVLFSPLIDWGRVIASNRIHGISPRAKAIVVLTIVRGYRAYRMIHLLFWHRPVVNRELNRKTSDVMSLPRKLEL
jgi:GT2 family glycosyltransferase